MHTLLRQNVSNPFYYSTSPLFCHRQLYLMFYLFRPVH